MTRKRIRPRTAAALAVVSLCLFPTPSMAQNVLFSENFDGVPLGPVVDEAVPNVPTPEDNVWTKTGPPGWTIDDSGMPVGGVLEWRGWSFANPIWWDQVAGQERANFSFGTDDVVAVADPDEWDDKAHDPGTFNSFLSTPPIPLAGIPANGATLSFDSSWRADGTQIATVEVAYDGGPYVELLRYESDQASPDYWPDANPDYLELDMGNPAGASEAVVRFGLTQAGNNWWWAVDNIDVSGPGGSAFFEDFEGVDLGQNIDEGGPFVGFNPDEVWTKTAPDGWTIDDSGVPGAGDPFDDGVTEWAGWSFAEPNWWSRTADDQGRSQFVKASGAIAVADPDEWDDQAHADAAENDWYETSLSTPPISLDGVEAGSVTIKFDSSWRPEFDDNYHQSANLLVSYDGAEPVEVLRWVSDPADPNFKPDATNETVELALDNPAGAGEMVATFHMFDAGNDWWWAIDNLEISGTGGGGGIVTRLQAGDADQDLDFDQLDLVAVQIAAKYLTGQAATWGEGDWDAAPGGTPGNPPAGDGLFNQLDIIAALNNGLYLTGPYGAIQNGGQEGDEQTSIVYDPSTGEIAVDAPASTELTSINIDSAGSIFTGEPAMNLGGSFDNDSDNNIFKATFGSSFGSLSFGTVAQAGLSEEFVRNDLTVVGSLAGGGDLGSVDLIYVPEPTTMVLLLAGLLGAVSLRRTRERKEA